MIKSPAIVAKVTLMVVNKELSYAEGAELLEVSVRSMRNYVKRYLEQGVEGLIDHRRGHHRKLTPEEEQQIVECKIQRPRRSTRWIRDRLKLNVSVEAVRQVIVKHFNHTGTTGVKVQPQVGLMDGLSSAGSSGKIAS